MVCSEDVVFTADYDPASIVCHGLYPLVTCHVRDIEIARTRSQGITLLLGSERRRIPKKQQTLHRSPDQQKVIYVGELYEWPKVLADAHGINVERR